MRLLNFRASRPEEPDDQEKLTVLFKTVLAAVRAHQKAWPFLEPVSPTEVPDYYDHIKYPMDLQTMGERLENGYYVTKKLFVADMSRIFSNCRIYNSQDTQYYASAGIVEKYFQSKMKEHSLWEKEKKNN